MRKIAGILAALTVASAMSFGAGAQNIIDDVIDGAENVVDDTADTAEDIVGGGNESGNGNTIGGSGNDSPIVDDTEDDDIPDQVEDDSSDNNPTAGKDENTTTPETNEEDPNPATGVPFMTAGLVAISAAGVAYLSRKRNGSR